MRDLQLNFSFNLGSHRRSILGKSLVHIKRALVISYLLLVNGAEPPTKI